MKVYYSARKLLEKLEVSEAHSFLSCSGRIIKKIKPFMLSDISRLIVIFDLYHFSKKDIPRIQFLILMQFWMLDNIADIKKWEFWLKSSLFHLHF